MDDGFDRMTIDEDALIQPVDHRVGRWDGPKPTVGPPMLTKLAL